jgi:hypothetical protein
LNGASVTISDADKDRMTSNPGPFHPVHYRTAMTIATAAVL